MSANYTLGAQPSPPDSRDYAIKTYLPESPPPLPKSRDFSGVMQDIRNQGAEGTCVGPALASGVMGYEEKTILGPDGKAINKVLSVRDAFMNGGGKVGGNGIAPRNALQGARDMGVCLEIDRPYTPNQDSPLSANALSNRLLNKLSAYASVPTDTDNMKQAIYWHGPILIVIPVTPSFYSPDANGFVGEDDDSTIHGYHAVTLDAWDDDRQAFGLRNSWGADWGHMKGRCWYRYTFKRTEAWSAVGGESSTPVPAAPWWAHLFGW